MAGHDSGGHESHGHDSAGHDPGGQDSRRHDSGRQDPGRHDPGGHDSGGQLWSGRSLSGTGFDADDGSADPALIRALSDPGDESALVAVVAAARLMVPVVAVAGGRAAGPAGLARSPGAPGADQAARLAVETSTDMASVTLTAPDGSRALPAFSSTAALAAWDPTARPVPVTAARAAQAAVAERCDVLVLDLGATHSVLLRPSMVWALAQQRAWLPAYQDPVVRSAVDRAVADEPDVAWSGTEQGEPAGSGVLRIELGVVPGLDGAALEGLATRVGERLATDGEVRARIDEVSFAVRPA